MNDCPICNGKVVETDKWGLTEECELCGTVYKLLPMPRGDETESNK